MTPSIRIRRTRVDLAAGLLALAALVGPIRAVQQGNELTGLSVTALVVEVLIAWGLTARQGWALWTAILLSGWFVASGLMLASLSTTNPQVTVPFTRLYALLTGVYATVAFLLLTFSARGEFSDPTTWHGPGCVPRAMYVVGGGLGLAAFMTREDAPFLSKVGVSLIGVAIGAVGKVLSHYEQRYGQRFRDQAAESIIRTVSAGEHARFSLYLRPFSTTGKLPQIRSEDAERGRGGATIDFETLLAAAVQGTTPLVALGRSGEQVGAGRIQSGDDAWQRTFALLAPGAEIIFVLPGESESVRWEVDWLRTNQLLGRCIFLAPREGRLFTVRTDGTTETVRSSKFPARPKELAEDIAQVRAGVGDGIPESGLDQELHCPQCDHPYHLSDYRPDVPVIRCSRCKEPLPWTGTAPSGSN